MAFEKFENRNKVFDDLPATTGSIRTTSHNINTAGHVVIPPFTAVRLTAPREFATNTGMPARAATRGSGFYETADGNRLTFTAVMPGTNEIAIDLQVGGNPSLQVNNGNTIRIRYRGDNSSFNSTNAIAETVNNNSAAAALVITTGSSNDTIGNPVSGSRGTESFTEPGIRVLSGEDARGAIPPETIDPVVNIMPWPETTAPTTYGLTIPPGESMDFRTEKDEMYIHWQAFTSPDPSVNNFMLRVVYW